ncbi:MAG: hypothetical protein ABJQ14_12745, partial [Hyphomicrobiales bacterium]
KMLLAVISAAGCSWHAVSLSYRAYFFTDGSSQPSVGGMCYRDVPSMSQIQPPAQAPTMATLAG